MTKPTLVSVAIAATLGLPTTFAAEQKTNERAATAADASLNQDIEVLQIRHVPQPYRGNVSPDELPQAVVELDGADLEAMGITDLHTALSQVNGIVPMQNLGGLWDAFAIRGFSGDENLPSAYLINGFSAGRGFSGIRDTASVEYIEVLKGPGSALYGRGEPGGTVNIVTKKPQFTTEGMLQMGAGRYDDYRFEGDFTTGLTDDLAFRINGSYIDSGSFRDTVETEALAISPSLHWHLNNDTSVLYEGEFQRQSKPFDRGIVVLEGQEPLDRHVYLGEPGDGDHEVDAQGHQLTLFHDLADNWRFSAGLGYRTSSLVGQSSDAELSPSRQLIFEDGETLSRQQRNRNHSTEDLSARFELSGEMDWLGVRHNLLSGADIYDFTYDNKMSRWRPDPGETTYSINIYNPIYGQVAPDVSPVTDRTEHHQAIGFYLQDMIELTDQWQVLIGARFDHLKQGITDHLLDPSDEGHYQKLDLSRVSPRAGVVYQPIEGLSFYASYSEGFNPNSNTDRNNEGFEPEESKASEIGVKWENEYLVGSLAVFQANKTNVLTGDPIDPTFMAAIGKARSQGVELDITALLGASTQLDLSYAWIDAETRNTVTDADWGIEIPKGSPLLNIAEHSGFVNLRHNAHLSGRPLEVGGTYHYVGERLGDTVDPDFWLPSYQRVDLFASVELSHSLLLRARIENLFDTEYLVSSYARLWVQPGEPRNAQLTLQYRF
ncbi:iron complex outermembrane recepter protein [Ferrimonas marina]|uniref:Iron complex outermembrane recepter protein n=1 Tax=Ferrimonas marina TaxID=299255 RepID=A0A1M5N6Z0_9GAMM|nr:iron complex outermembrane recepter protein [Ferrimonas marina]